MLREEVVLIIIGCFIGAGIIPCIHGLDEIGNKFDNESLDNGLIAYWNFDEGSGNSLYDSSGNDYSGVIYGATWTDGITGSSLYFDGIDDYVEIVNSENIDLSDGITISTWIKIDYKEDYGVIIGKNHNNIDEEWILVKQPDNRLTFEVSSTAGAYNSEEAWTDPLNDNIWYHVAGSYDGKDLKIYINGEIKDTISWLEGLRFGSNTIKIGTQISNGEWATYFKGSIDEIKIFNKALSDEEILHVYYEIDIIPPEVDIEFPRDGFFYLGGIELFPFPVTVIIGPRDGFPIEIEASDDLSGIDLVEIIIDDNNYRTTYNPLDKYYEYFWKEFLLGKLCTLRAEAHDMAGNSASSNTLIVWYFNIPPK